MEHFEYVKNMVGIDHVGFGVDCLYGDHVGVHHAFAQALSIAATSKTGAEYEEVPYVKYLENPTESSWNIIRWLVTTTAMRILPRSSAVTPSGCCRKSGPDAKTDAGSRLFLEISESIISHVDRYSCVYHKESKLIKC